MDLRRYVENRPVNNFGKIYLAAKSEPLPESLGGNCIWHVHKLTAILNSQGYTNIVYGKDKSTNHTIIFADKDSEKFIFDPVLSHWSPISFDCLLQDVCIINDGHPIINGKPSLIVSKVEADGIRMGKALFDERPFIYKEYFYSGASSNLPALDDLDIANSIPQDLFYLLCQSRAGIERCLTYNFVRKTFRIRVSGGGDLVSVSKDGPDFERHLESISNQTNVPGVAIKQYMLEASSILKELRQRAACAL